MGTKDCDNCGGTHYGSIACPCRTDSPEAKAHRASATCSATGLKVSECRCMECAARETRVNSGAFIERLVGGDRNAKVQLRDRNSTERKAEPVHSGVLMYFPDALAAVSRISKAGNDKHNPGEPLHWARGKSTDQMDCLARHALTPEGIDPDSGEFEQAQVAWRALAQLQLMEERRLTAAGIRPYSGVTS